MDAAFSAHIFYLTPWVPKNIWYLIFLGDITKPFDVLESGSNY